MWTKSWYKLVCVKWKQLRHWIAPRPRSSKSYCFQWVILVLYCEETDATFEITSEIQCRCCRHFPKVVNCAEQWAYNFSKPKWLLWTTTSTIKEDQKGIKLVTRIFYFLSEKWLPPTKIHLPAVRWRWFQLFVEAFLSKNENCFDGNDTVQNHGSMVILLFKITEYHDNLSSENWWDSFKQTIEVYSFRLKFDGRCSHYEKVVSEPRHH